MVSLADGILVLVIEICALENVAFAQIKMNRIPL